jgi:2-dehydropantoate 2-reductase
LSAALARCGLDVVVLMRPESLDQYQGRFAVSSQVLGDFEVAVPAVTTLDREVDVLWVTPKATQLAAALTLAPPERVGGALVVPLMNGVDHMAVLRARYPAVAAGALRVAAERMGAGRISQTSPFIRIDLVGPERIALDVRAAGIDCVISADELNLLWQKLAFLAPLALATTVAHAPLGSVRRDESYLRAQQEALAVAEAEGATIDVAALEALRAAAPDTMRSSMQHDVELQRMPELDAIAGPILRGGRRHGIETPATQRLADQVRALAGMDPQPDQVTAP